MGDFADDAWEAALLEDEEEDLIDRTEDNWLGRFLTTPVPKGAKKMPVEEGKLFKVVTGKDDVVAVVIEYGLKREPIIESYPRSMYRLKGFTKVSQFASGYNRTGTDIFSMRGLFDQLCNLLNTHHACDYLTEDQYMKVLEAYEPYIHQALAFEEFEELVDSSSVELPNSKKKAIFRRGERRRR
jgi:hypothetical protein